MESNNGTLRPLLVAVNPETRGSSDSAERLLERGTGPLAPLEEDARADDSECEYVMSSSCQS